MCLMSALLYLIHVGKQGISLAVTYVQVGKQGISLAVTLDHVGKQDVCHAWTERDRSGAHRPASQPILYRGE